MDGSATAAQGRLIARPRVVKLLDGASSPVTVLTAGAGFGKSIVVRLWLADRPTAWLTLTERDREAEGLAGHLVEALMTLEPRGARVAKIRDDDPAMLLRAVTRQASAADTERSTAIVGVVADAFEALAAVKPGLAIVLDDLHELDGSPAESIVSGLVRRVPPGAQLVITTRTGLPFATQRLRARGDVLELSARDLALDVEETTRVAETVLGSHGTSLAPQLHEVTGGWPAAVRLLVESVRSVPPDDRSRLLAAERHRGESLFAYLTEEVLGREPRAMTDLIRTIAPHDAVDAELCLALGVSDSETAIGALVRRGLFISPTGRPDRVSLHRLVRDYALERLPLSPGEHLEGQRIAARWHERHGDIEHALVTAMNIGDTALVERLIADHAADLLARGRVDVVISAARSLPDADRPVLVELALGDSLAFRGRVDEALVSYRRATVAPGPPAAAIAWRIAKLEYESGDMASAGRTLADAARAGTAADEAFVLAYGALVRLFSGDEAEEAAAVDIAVTAAVAADRSGDPTAESLGHMAVGYALLASDPPRARRELSRAIDAAIRAGDVVQIVRLRNADDLPSLEEQFDVATDTLALVEAAGNPSWLARTLVSRGLVALDLGRYEVAAADLGRARQGLSAAGSAAGAMPIAFLAELARIRGDIAQAANGFRAAIKAADAVGDRNLSSFARAGLARVLARTDPALSRSLIDRSLLDAVDLHRHDYLVAAAWIAACQGRPAEARDHATAAMALAGDAPGRAVTVASAIELLGILAETRAEQLGRLDEAAAIYRRIGNVPAQSTTELAIAVIGDGPGSPAAHLASRRLQAAGVRASAAEGAGLLAMLPAFDVAALSIRVLGGFAVLRAGRPVSAGEWRSRKSRDLLKFLVTRRGVPATREELAEVLWPDQTADGLSNRLSVALSLLRGVLDPDRAHRPDRFVTTERQAVALRHAEVSIDLEDFVSDARAGLERLAAGATVEAESLLSSAEGRYAGELLPEDLAADWTTSPREEARSLYLHVTRSLGGLAAERGDVDVATRYLMRAIAADPYDEPAHLELVRCLRTARRHGEAHRAYERYLGRMAELDVEPAPFPADPGSAVS